MTVFGQSSGGTAVLALLASPASRGLFSRAMSLSGSPNVTMDRATQRAQHAHIVAALGCGGGGGTVNATHTRACLLAKTPAELLKAIPLGKSHAAGTLSNPSWLMANIFDVPRFADGLRAPGIAAVDGAVVAAPLLEALARPVVDVPLIVSTMAQEPGAWPNNMFNASAMSPVQFQQQLAEDWDQVFGDGFAASVVKLYGADVADNAQKAWDTIAADAGVFCGNKRAASAFKSDVYSLHNEVYGTDTKRFAFHGRDLVYATQGAGAQGARIRDIWFEFASTGAVAAWTPVGGGGSGATTMRLTNNATLLAKDFKADVCALWSAHAGGRDGFGRFWWSN